MGLANRTGRPQTTKRLLPQAGGSLNLRHRPTAATPQPRWHLTFARAVPQSQLGRARRPGRVQATTLSLSAILYSSSSRARLPLSYPSLLGAPDPSCRPERHRDLWPPISLCPVAGDASVGGASITRPEGAEHEPGLAGNKKLAPRPQGAAAARRGRRSGSVAWRVESPSSSSAVAGSDVGRRLVYTSLSARYMYVRIRTVVCGAPTPSPRGETSACM
nr:unnamed protein product [Digitaria exilis]